VKNTHIAIRVRAGQVTDFNFTGFVFQGLGLKCGAKLRKSASMLFHRPQSAFPLTLADTIKKFHCKDEVQVFGRFEMGVLFKSIPD
jgi:hypothetical protein